MNTPYSVIQPNNFVRNTEFETEVNRLTNCGAHMTSSGGGALIISGSSQSWFQDGAEVQIVSYGDNAPTKKERTGSGGGFGFEINKSGYYDLYAYFRYNGDFQVSQSVIGFEYEDSDGNAITVNSATDRRSAPGKWITTTVSSGGGNIARINDNVMGGIKLNKGDCAYFVGDPIVNTIRGYEYSLYFNIKYIADNPEFSV